MAVAGDINRAADAFGTEVRRTSCGRCEEKVGPGVDGDPVAFLRPGQERIETAQSCLDMRHRHIRVEAGERSAKRAGRVALDDDQLRIGAVRLHRSGDAVGISDRIAVRTAVKLDRRIIAEAIGGEIEAGVLARPHDRRGKAAAGEGVDDRYLPDGFGTGPVNCQNGCAQQQALR